MNCISESKRLYIIFNLLGMHQHLLPWRQHTSYQPLSYYHGQGEIGIVYWKELAHALPADKRHNDRPLWIQNSKILKKCGLLLIPFIIFYLMTAYSIWVIYLPEYWWPQPTTSQCCADAAVMVFFGKHTGCINWENWAHTPFTSWSLTSAEGGNHSS